MTLWWCTEDNVYVHVNFCLIVVQWQSGTAFTQVYSFLSARTSRWFATSGQCT